MTGMTNELSGKTILITGATNGIGLEASVQLAERGASIVMVGRDPTRTAAAVADVKARSGSSTVTALLCDFASQASIRALAAAFLVTHDRLDVLVNNAGAANEKRELTVDGIETTFAVNHLGYFLLTNLLLDVLVRSAPARIVNVASRGHLNGTVDFDDLGFEKGRYGILTAYCPSKLGNVLFTVELARRLQGKGITVNCLHPGGVATGIWVRAPWWARPVISLITPFAFITPAEGGQTLTYLAASPDVEGKTGLYFVKNQPAEMAALARDPAIASKLWDVSAQLVQLG